MSKVKLQAARELIREKQYQAARALLETIPDNTTALKWLIKLDDIAPPPMPRKPAKRRRSWLPVLMLILGLVLGFVLGKTDLLQQATQAVNRLTSRSAPAPTLTTTLIPTEATTETEAPTLTPESTPTFSPSATPASLTFQGEENRVMSAINIPAGSYRVIVTTSGAIDVSVNPTEGECGAGSSFLTSILFSLNPGQAEDGTEAIFTSRNCTAEIEVFNSEGAWTLEFKTE